MFGWIVRIALLAIVVTVGVVSYRFVERESVCHQTNRCEERLRGLGTLLEFYSADQVIAQEARTHERSERRAFYPSSLADLARSAQEAGVDNFRCPIFGVDYRYKVLQGGKSFFACCPARHRFHPSEQPFVNAITPEESRLHLFVRGGKVQNLVGGHPMPYDFQEPVLRAEETPLAPDLVEMLPENPRPSSSW